MAKISIFSVLSNVQMLLHTFLKGKRVGTDSSGNIYYTAKPRKGTKQERRWVIYAKGTDASQVPPEWHGWLHHQTDVVPERKSKYYKDWIIAHQPNMTGTARAYMPPSLKGEPRAASSMDYVSWQPSHHAGGNRAKKHR